MERECEGAQCRIDKELGKGSFGCVYRLTSSQSPHGRQCKYALKVIEGHGVGVQEQEAAHKELRIMQGLYHPAIVTLVDSFQVHHRLLLVLELCEGGDLRNYLDTLKKRRLAGRRGAEESLVVQWTLQLTEGLQYLHHKKILHRDLKPQNIFLKDKFSIKIGDLGIARQLACTKEMAATHIGTPLYISPEIYKGNPYSYKTDIWSLGCCVYEMMTCQYAFHAASRFELVGRVVNKQQLETEQPPIQSGRSQRSTADLNRPEIPKEAKALKDWRLRTAKALTHFLNEKQAMQHAQIKAALDQHLTADSIKDITGSSGDASSSDRASSSAKRRQGEPNDPSSSDEETEDGEDGTDSLSPTESGSSDLTLSSENTQRSSAVDSTTLCASTTAREKGRGMNRSRLVPGELSAERSRQRRGYQNRETDDEDTDDSDVESESTSSTVIPPCRVKIGKSSMVIRARPLPLPNCYREQVAKSENSPEDQSVTETDSHLSTSSSLASENATLEKKTTSSIVNSSQSQQSGGQQQSSNNKGVDMAYANEVLQYAKARLLPMSSPQDISTDSNHEGGRHSLRGEAEGSSSGANSSPETEKAVVRKGRVRDPAAQRERMRGAEAGVTNKMMSEAGVKDEQDGEMAVRSRDAVKGTGARDTDREEDKGAAFDPETKSQGCVGQDKGKKKKRNFLKERRHKDTSGKGANGEAEGAGKVTVGDDAHVDKAAMEVQKEHGVKLFTRAQRVTFLSLQEEEDMDLSIGAESERPVRQIVLEMGEARLHAAVSTAILLPHNPSLLELHLRDILGQENYKKYATAITKMAGKRLLAMRQ